MPPVEATFRPVAPDILNYLEQAIQQTEADRSRTTLRIGRLRRRARHALLRRTNSLKRELHLLNTRELSEARLCMEAELRSKAEALLTELRVQADRTVESVLREILGTDSELATRAALRRLASILTLLSRQHELTVTFNPEQFNHPSVREFCTQHHLNCQADDSCLMGDLRIELPAGAIESSLAEDVEMLIEHLGQSLPSSSPETTLAHA